VFDGHAERDVCLEAAVALAAKFSLEEPEPGPYYVAEVLDQL
jgi:hypothetical protein